MNAGFCIMQDLQHFPCVDVKLKLQNEDKDQSRPPILSIRLQMKDARRSTSRAFSPRFPKVSNYTDYMKCTEFTKHSEVPGYWF